QCWSPSNSAPHQPTHSSAPPTAHLQAALLRPSSHRKHSAPAPRPFLAPLPSRQSVSHPSTPNPPPAFPTAPRAPAASAPDPSDHLPSCSQPALALTVSNHFLLWHRPRAPNRKRSN